MERTSSPARTSGATTANVGQDSSKGRARKQLWVAVAVILVFVVALVGKAVVSFTTTKQSAIPVLTAEDFNRAKQTWESHAIDSYDMDLVFLGGSNKEKIHLEVRKGVVTAVTKNGKPPAQQKTREEWTVPNQFTMIGEDLAKHARGGFSTKEGVVIVLRGEFDPELGYPKRYVLDVVKGRSPLRSNWTVTKFQAVP